MLLYQSAVIAEIIKSILYKATDCLTSREGEVGAGKEGGGGISKIDIIVTLIKAHETGVKRGTLRRSKFVCELNTICVLITLHHMHEKAICC